MKIHVIRLKLNYQDGTAKPEGGLIYDMENEEQRNHYIKDMCIIETGYAYQITVEEE